MENAPRKALFTNKRKLNVYRESAEEKQPVIEALDSSTSPDNQNSAALFIADYALSILKKFLREDNASLASRVRAELESEGIAVHFPSMEISHAHYNTGLEKSFTWFYFLLGFVCLFFFFAIYFFNFLIFQNLFLLFSPHFLPSSFFCFCWVFSFLLKCPEVRWSSDSERWRWTTRISGLADQR